MQKNIEAAASGAVVMTSISAPNAVMKRIAQECRSRRMRFLVIGDAKSPSNFALSGCEFYSVEAQRESGLPFALACPTRHYARKNIGCLLAMREQIDFIAETDDDNMPSEDFYVPLPREVNVPVLQDTGWINLYRYYTDNIIWPRGLPLDAINAALPELGSPTKAVAPIQQGLADANPDVDAIYRLALPLPLYFERKVRVATGPNAWCPFNSQNTIHYREAFPLLYLPSYCSFRMTDIWRSLVAQRICWENGWSILFREATVVQDRNDHSLMRDFEDEVSGYLGNRKMAEILGRIPLRGGPSNIPEDMRKCYAALVEGQFVRAEELSLLDAFLRDIPPLEHHSLATHRATT